MFRMVRSSLPSRSQPYIDPVIEAYKPGVDRTIIRHNLRLTPQQRVEALQELMRTIAEMNRAGQAIREAVKRENDSL